MHVCKDVLLVSGVAAQLAMCSPCKQEDLSLVFRGHAEKSQVWWHAFVTHAFVTQGFVIPWLCHPGLCHPWVVIHGFVTHSFVTQGFVTQGFVMVERWVCVHRAS